MQQLVLLGNTIMHTTTYARYGRLSKTTFIEYCPLLQGDIVTFCVAFATQDINFSSLGYKPMDNQCQCNIIAYNLMAGSFWYVCLCHCPHTLGVGQGIKAEMIRITVPADRSQ